METLALAGKEHDELRQGEAFKPFSNDPNTYKKSFYIESYGCAMNFADSEVIASILNKEGYGATRNVENADLIFLNTCSIREKAEQTVRKRLTEFRKIKEQKPGTLIGMLGCMAERLKSKLLEEENQNHTIINKYDESDRLFSSMTYRDQEYCCTDFYNRNENGFLINRIFTNHLKNHKEITTYKYEFDDFKNIIFEFSSNNIIDREYETYYEIEYFE